MWRVTAQTGQTGQAGPPGRHEPTPQNLQADSVLRVMPGGAVVLDHLDASFAPGSMTAVVGTNGSGKSTLARVLANVDAPDEGRVVLPTGRALFIPEQVSTLPGTSVRALVRALAPSLSTTGRAAQPRLEAALGQLESQHGPGATLSSLSKGTLQKAYLALAWALAPRVLIADEPFTGLDLDSEAAAISLLGQLAATGSIVVVMRHGRAPWADLELILHNGALIEPTGPDGRRRRSTASARLTVSPARRALAAGPEPHWDAERDGETVLLHVPDDEVDQALRWALDAELRIARLVRDPA